VIECDPIHVDRILKDVRLPDLPALSPAKIELVVDLSVAETQAPTLPKLVRTQEVAE
jgi:hypothetical protein